MIIFGHPVCHLNRPTDSSNIDLTRPGPCSIMLSYLSHPRGDISIAKTKMPRGGRRDDSPRTEHRGRSQSRRTRPPVEQGLASSSSNLAIRGSIGLASGSTGQPTDQGEASGPAYRNQQMIRDVNDKLTNIRKAVHEFTAETSLWVEELLHAQGSGIEGVEMVAGTLSNIAVASKRHLQLAISEDYDGFIQDLDNFTGPMRVQTGLPEDRKRQKRANIDDDSPASSPRRPCQDTRYDELSPDSTSYLPPPQPPRTTPTESIIQQRTDLLGRAMRDA